MPQQEVQDSQHLLVFGLGTGGNPQMLLPEPADNDPSVGQPGEQGPGFRHLQIREVGAAVEHPQQAVGLQRFQAGTSMSREASSSSR